MTGQRNKAMVSAVARLEEGFRRIEQERMADLPILNGNLRVEAVGFRVWGTAWLGVLITPWFMNLILLPQRKTAWDTLKSTPNATTATTAIPTKPTNQSIERFPAGELEFLTAGDALTGKYRSCILFSTMHAFADQATARNVAEAALGALIHPEPQELPLRPEISRRAFLRGDFRGERA